MKGHLSGCLIFLRNCPENRSSRTCAKHPQAQSGQLGPGIFISEVALAERWLHSIRSLQRWRASGTSLPFVRIGRRIVYRLADVEAFEADEETGSQP